MIAVWILIVAWEYFVLVTVMFWRPRWFTQHVEPYFIRIFKGLANLFRRW